MAGGPYAADAERQSHNLKRHLARGGGLMLNEQSHGASGGPHQSRNPSRATSTFSSRQRKSGEWAESDRLSLLSCDRPKSGPLGGPAGPPPVGRSVQRTKSMTAAGGGKTMHQLPEAETGSVALGRAASMQPEALLSTSRSGMSTAAVGAGGSGTKMSCSQNQSAGSNAQRNR